MVIDIIRVQSIILQFDFYLSYLSFVPFVLLSVVLCAWILNQELCVPQSQCTDQSCVAGLVCSPLAIVLQSTVLVL